MNASLVGRFALGLALLSLLAPWHATSAQDAPDCEPGVNYERRAEAALTEDQYGTAINALSCVLDADPGDTNAYFERARAAILAGALDGEFGYGISTDLNEVYNNASGRIEEEIALLTDVLDEDPENLEALAQRAYFQWYVGQDEQGIEDYTSILTQDRENVFAYVYRGVAQLYLDRTAKAEGDFRRAAQFAGDNADVPAVIASAYSYAGDSEQAIAYYDQAIALDPEDASLLLNRAYEHELMGNMERALEDYSGAIAITPDDPYAYQTRGWAYINVGEFANAVADFDQSVALDPTDRWSALGRGTATQRLGDEATAAPYFAEYVSLMEQDSRNARLSGGRATLAMTEGVVYRIALNLSEGESLTVTAISPDASVDPLIVLFNGMGQAIAGNDDISEEDFNAGIEDVSIPATGIYTLVVTHAGAGSEGEIVVEVETQTAA